MIDGSENAIVSWLLNFRIRMFAKSAVMKTTLTNNVASNYTVDNLKVKKLF